MRLATIQEVQELHSNSKLVGCFQLPDAVYNHKDCPGVRKSQLDNIEESPAYYKYRLENPKEESKTFRMGRALHCAVLEPDMFPHRWVECSYNKGTKKHIEFMKLYPGRKPLTPAEMRDVMGMRQKVLSVQLARKLLAGHHEWTFFWIDPVTGLLCRCRADSIHPKIGMIADLKKSLDASENFIKSIFDYRYHVQAGYYLDGVNQAIEQSGENPLEIKMPDKFFFVAVEEDAPYHHGCYDIPGSFIDEGRKCYKENLATLKKCLETDIWPGVEFYNDEGKERVRRLRPHTWMYKN